MEDTPSWDEWFAKIAEVTATKSKDRSTKVGCVIVGADKEVLSIGYNDLPRGVVDCDSRRTERPKKYDYAEHAERNAIYNAARQGIRLLGATAYINWKGAPCTPCTRALIQAGIKEIITATTPFPGVGKGKFYDTEGPAEDMLREAGVGLRTITGEDLLCLYQQKHMDTKED